MTTILIAGLTPASQATADDFRAAGHRLYAADIAHAPALLEDIKTKEGKLDMLVFAPEKILSDGDILAADAPLPAGSSENALSDENLLATDAPLLAGHDPEAIYSQMEHNILGFYTIVEAAKELLRQGGKRICVLTDRSASIRRSTETGDFGWHMSLAAVNMMEKIYFNALRPEGFTFRCFAAGGKGDWDRGTVLFNQNRGFWLKRTVPLSQSGLTPAQYFTMPLCYDPSEPYTHSDENRLAFRDPFFDEIAF